MISETDKLRNQQNTASEEISMLKSKGEDTSSMIVSMKEVSRKLKEIKQKMDDLNHKFRNLLINIPNIPHESIPVGPGPESNEIIRSWGKHKKFKFKPLTHIELAEKLNIIDFQRASKITGSNFILYRSEGAKLERALINFMIDIHVKEHGYTEVAPPFLVNRDSMMGTGQLPKLEEDMYIIESEDYFLIPTAEVPVTNIHRDEVLDEGNLPLKYVAYTPCFRKEAGSYGKDTKGLVRVHQFDKVEMVNFTKPEDSYNRLEGLVKEAERILQLLELPYRVICLSTGDISFAASKCYDLEVWAPGLDKFLEVSSCSNFVDFQARRANIRYKAKKTSGSEFLHTLNGSGVALARTVIALLENHQQKDGSIIIPKALRPYMDKKIIKPI